MTTTEWETMTGDESGSTGAPAGDGQPRGGAAGEEITVVDTDDGGSTVELTCGSRNLLLVMNLEDGRVYFTARKDTARWAGIAVNRQAVFYLLRWVGSAYADLPWEGDPSAFEMSSRSAAPREAAPPLPALTCELCGRTDLALWLLPKGKACITCYGAHHRDVEHARIVARIQEMGRNCDVYNDVASVIEAEGPGGKTP